MIPLAMTGATLLLTAAALAGGGDHFAIEVVDSQSGRGVPLVELETVHAVRYLTDSAGVVAFHEPGLMNTRVFFFIRSHGYEFPADGFGMRGKALDVTPGGRARLEIRRINIAERLYRVTGGGIYRDSALLGRPAPTQRPVLSGLVLGQDSVFAIVHRDRIYWFWGDTARPAYPLGNFHMSGATSQLPEHGGLDPEIGVNLEYFVDEAGFSRPMAPVPGDGPTWADAFVVARDDEGRERMYAAYAKIKPPLEAYERGLIRLDDEKQQFEKVLAFPLDAPVYPSGHALETEEDGVEYFCFAAPFPLTRVRATAEDYLRISSCEAFTCLKEGTRPADGELDRPADGTLRYSWKRGTPVLGQTEQEKMIRDGRMKREEALLHLRDADTGKMVLAHAGSVYWNAHRRRWVMITCEQHGTSFLGETWFAEADTPLGPWVYARKVVTHEKYSFYNPKQHPMLAKSGGRIIFFEGTYTHSFSGNSERTPRYDYNQVMYKLDLDDPRLVLPVPVYRIPGRDSGRSASVLATGLPPEAQRAGAEVAFFALDRPRPGALAVRAVKTAGGSTALEIGDPGDPGKADDAGGSGAARPLFYALPPDAKSPPATCVPLFAYASADGSRREYSTEKDPPAAGLRPAASPFCLVWRNPMGAHWRW
ncbi:MAG: hypothetical protein JXA90_11440 [Planctomycetes bacterium]|nr:hypothetical protein [Planctomycetota bacterium]